MRLPSVTRSFAALTLVAVVPLTTTCGDDALGDDVGSESAAQEEEALAFAPNISGARATIADVVLPNLLQSSAFVHNEGDNLARMSIVKRSLELARDALALPDAQRAATLLKSEVIPMLESSPGYRWILASNPNAFAATKLGKARTGIGTAVRQLTGATPAANGAWPVYVADTAGASAKLTGTVLPKLTTSTGFTLNTGDNLARMSVVKRALEIARDVLALPVPDPARARVLVNAAVVVLEASPGYRKVVADNPSNFAGTKLGLARAGLTFVTQKTTSSPAVFMRPGVFIVDGNQWSASSKGALLRDNGYGWVAIKTHHGPEKEGDAYLAQGLVAAYHAFGIQVGGWGYLTGEPEVDAAVAAEQTDRWGLDFYLADAEAEYKWTQGNGTGDAVAYGRSLRFANAFRALEPNLPAAVSSFGARSDVEHLVDIDYTAWRTHGFDLMQQVYWNDYEFFRPSRCIRAALNDGWPIQRIHPTFGIWGSGITRVVTAQEYLDDIASTGVYGYNTFIGEQMSDAETVSLGSGVGRGLAR